jgi:hypothetical protein
VSAPAAIGNPLLEAALRYARLGWRVIPLVGKKPFLDDWPHLATTDEGQIRRWWLNNSRSNVGIKTGAESGIFAVDVDPRHGGEDTLEGLVLKHGPLPDTLQQITPTGGRHLIFRHPGFHVKTCQALLPGIDIRGDGNGQIVSEPSIHPDVKKPYFWDGLQEIENQPIATAPTWLLALLRDKVDKPKHAEALPEKIPHGKQHDTLLSLAGTLWRRGLSVDEIETTLWDVNQRRCEKPGPRSDMRKMAESMSKYPRDVRNNVFTMAGQAEPASRQKRKLEAIDGETIFEADYPEPVFTIGELLARGVTLFCGRPKVGKSWFTLQLAIAVATARRLFDRFPIETPGRVVYLALEEPKQRTGSRMKKLYRDAACHLQNLHFVYGIDPLLSGGAQMLDEYLTENPAQMVVIDTFLALVRANNQRDVLRSDYNEVNVLRQIAEKHNTALLLVHHQRKMSADYHVDSVAGTTGLTAACDAIWSLRKRAEGDCLLEVTGREMKDTTLALRFQDGSDFGWHMIGEGAEAALSEERQDILTLLRVEGPQKPAKIALLLKKNANTVRVLLQKLAYEGFVTRNQKGEYQPSLTPINSVNGVNGENE